MSFYEYKYDPARLTSRINLATRIGRTADGFTEGTRLASLAIWTPAGATALVGALQAQAIVAVGSELYRAHKVRQRTNALARTVLRDGKLHVRTPEEIVSDKISEGVLKVVDRQVSVHVTVAPGQVVPAAYEPKHSTSEPRRDGTENVEQQSFEQIMARFDKIEADIKAAFGDTVLNKDSKAQEPAA